MPRQNGNDSTTSTAPRSSKPDGPRKSKELPEITRCPGCGVRIVVPSNTTPDEAIRDHGVSCNLFMSREDVKVLRDYWVSAANRERERRKKD